MPDNLSPQDWKVMWDAARVWDKRNKGRERMCRQIYQRYLRSDAWKARTQIIWNRSTRCERCKLYPGENVHHRKPGTEKPSYARLFREEPEDLMLLCRGCHEYIHKLSTEDPKDWRLARQRDFWHVGEAA
jgi:predicted HNH restriction endonuclease